MDLTQVQHPATTQLSGSDSGIVVPAGQRLIIETSPGGSEILDVEVPAGKQWILNIGVDIRETDV